MSFPLSWTGTWRVEREILSVDGDPSVAERAWRSTGGEGKFEVGAVENYSVDFVTHGGVDAEAFPDWRSEISSRCRLSPLSVVWEPARPDILEYFRADGGAAVRLAVESRVLLRTFSSYGALDVIDVSERRGGSRRLRTLQLSRTYKPVNDAGEIIGREVLETCDAPSVPGEVASPTSTTKSKLTLRSFIRPLTDPVRRRDVGQEAR